MTQANRFTTAASKAYGRKILHFTYTADIPENIADIHSLRVYYQRDVVYQSALKTDGKPHRAALDITDVTGDAWEAVLRISLYRDGEDPGEAQIFIDTIRLSGSPDPTVDFVNHSAGYFWTNPSIYANRAECGIENGTLKLRIPSTSDEVFTEAYIDIGFDVRNSGNSAK